MFMHWGRKILMISNFGTFVGGFPRDGGASMTVKGLIVGSLGSVHCRFESGLMLISIPTAKAKRIAKYCSVSVIIGSRIIWKQRCRSTL